MLLREAEIARGTVFHDYSETTLDESEITNCTLPDSSTMDSNSRNDMLDKVASAASVIDDHLVTWRSLKELQIQNQKLLCVARDLASQLEQREQEESDTSKQVTELSSRLETLSGELEVVRLSARQARTEANMAIYQRDQYKNILLRYDIKIAEDEVSFTEKDSCNSNEAKMPESVQSAGKG